MEFQWAIIRLLIGLSLPTLVLLVVNTRCGTWCQDPTTKQETTEIDQQWGIPLLDGSGGDSKTDYGNYTQAIGVRLQQTLTRRCYCIW